MRLLITKCTNKVVLNKMFQRSSRCNAVESCANKNHWIKKQNKHQKQKTFILNLYVL